MEYLDFDYAIINPKNLIGVDEFNQAFFDRIDQIEVDISNEMAFQTIVSNINMKPISVKNFRYSSDKDEIEKKIFELRKNDFDIFESGDNYILYKIYSIKEKKPDLNDTQTKKEIIKLVTQKNKFDYNRNLLEKIKNKKFNNNDFVEMGKGKIENIKLNSIKDNKKFQINAVEILYSLPVDSFTLVNDDENNIYLAKIKSYQNEIVNEEKLREYTYKQNSNIKSTILKSYDIFLNNKYNVVLNQKTIERVKNYFQ